MMGVLAFCELFFAHKKKAPEQSGAFFLELPGFGNSPASQQRHNATVTGGAGANDNSCKWRQDGSSEQTPRF